MILDLFSRKIVAYGISPKNRTYLITSTFKRASVHLRKGVTRSS
ncbi:MAG TPA: hypothetical protein DCM73_00010 [Clostridiales bacterium]|nr:hypothetical protein [Clostridiales bacterium]